MRPPVRKLHLDITVREYEGPPDADGLEEYIESFFYDIEDFELNVNHEDTEQ